MFRKLRGGPAGAPPTVGVMITTALTGMVAA
ncbi:potassium/proton antiporter, partial [Pseudomonas sp. S32]|nr:potassium/proton antiporter [Pseudomonas sp. S32]